MKTIKDTIYSSLDKVFTKRNFIYISISILLFLSGASILKYAPTNTIYSIIAAFITITSLQIFLWTIGIRNDFLSTKLQDVDIDNFLTEERNQEAEIKHRIHALKYHIRHLEDLPIKINNIRESKTHESTNAVKYILKLISNNNYSLAIIMLCNNLEKTIPFHIIKNYKSFTKHNEFNEDLLYYKNIISIYSSISKIRNDVVHNNMPISEEDTISVIDFGIRLMNIVENINYNHDSQKGLRT